MRGKIIGNLFDFWKEIGVSNGFYKAETAYHFTRPEDNSWPSKVFIYDASEVDYNKVHRNMELGLLPDSLNVICEHHDEKKILNSGFKKLSEVKPMALNITHGNKPELDFSSIQRVRTQLGARQFAHVASQSFGYPVHEKTILNLVSNSKIRMYIGKINDVVASCGMIFLDHNGDSGIHMIGTLSRHRGHGLGKIMTQKLMYEASKNKSKYVLLVASQLGEPIYSKIGFKTYGGFINYSV